MPDLWRRFAPPGRACPGKESFRFPLCYAPAETKKAGEKVSGLRVLSPVLEAPFFRKFSGSVFANDIPPASPKK
jgi:hypothetical protein